MAIVVLGSFMTDVVSYVTRLPAPGETLFGRKLVLCCGGKGANQCVAAARLGATTAIIGKLGDDSFGHSYMEALSKEGIDTKNVSMTREKLTGVAQIQVEDSGQNSIVIVAGANDELSVEDVAGCRDLVAGARVFSCVLEIPRPTALAGLALATQLSVRTVFNAAPAVADLEADFYALSDIFCVNEVEAALLTGVAAVDTDDQAVEAARRLLDKGVRDAVLLTLGRRGVLLLRRRDAHRPVFVDAPRVNAVDTTGAGDCFLGALAYFLAERPELSLEEVAARSCRVAAASVQQAGTQPSFPHRQQLDADLFL